MLEFINSQEVLNSVEARRKYAGKFFRYVSVERDTNFQARSTVRIIYIADKEDELYKAPRFTEDGERLNIAWGEGVTQDGIRITGVVRRGDKK